MCVCSDGKFSCELVVSVCMSKVDTHTYGKQTTEDAKNIWIINDLAGSSLVYKSVQTTDKMLKSTHTSTRVHGN